MKSDRSKPVRRPGGEIRKVVLYARVSTVEQAEKDLSLPAQIGAMKKYCADKGLEIVGEYIEPGASGTDDNRPVFRRMLEEVFKPDSAVDAILTYQTSRFMRNAAKARTLKDALRKRGIRVIAICQEFGEDATGQLVEGFFELLDQWESDVNGMRTRAAMKENARRGFLNGSCAPFGYKQERVDVDGNVKTKLVVNPPEQADVLRVFQLYVHGSGTKSVAREMNQLGHRYRGKLWTQDTVSRVISETAPTGTFYWGKVDTKTGLLRDESEWIAIPVEPIMTKELFDLAQEARRQRDPEKYPGRAASSPLLLANIVKCGKCGASFQLQTSGKDIKYRYYNCRSTLRTGKEACDGYRVPEATLNRQVLEHVAEKIFSEERCKKLIHDLIDESGILRQKTNEHRRQLQVELKDIERRIQRWEEAFESGTMPDDAGTDRLRDLKAKKNEIKDTLSKVVPLRPPPEALRSRAAIQRFQSNVKELLLSGNNGVARNYLRLLLDKIVIHGPEVHIHVKGAEAIALMAAPEISKEMKKETTEAVRTTVGGWLPEGLPCKNRFSNLPLPTSRYPERADSPLVPPMIVVLLNRAEEFRRLLDSGAVRNQADLARMFCLTRARVTQLLQLLDLEPSIRTYAKSLPPGTPTNMVTERGLRLLLKLPTSVQLRKAKRTVQGFSEYLTGLPREEGRGATAPALGDNEASTLT